MNGKTSRPRRRIGQLQLSLNVLSAPIKRYSRIAGLIILVEAFWGSKMTASITWLKADYSQLIGRNVSRCLLPGPRCSHDLSAMSELP